MLTSIATTNCLATDFCPALTVSDKTLSAAQTVCGLQEALHLQHCARFEEFNRFEFLKFGGGGSLCVSASVWANKCTKVQLDSVVWLARGTSGHGCTALPYSRAMPVGCKATG